MDSKGNIHYDPTPEEVEEKKLIPVEKEQVDLPRRKRREFYRDYAKAQRAGLDSPRYRLFKKKWGLDKVKPRPTETKGGSSPDVQVPTAT